MYRCANANFCRIYFNYMENNKNGGINFEDIIKYMYDKTNTMQPSFASKLLHTINPSKPILDSRVQYHLKLKTIQSQNTIPKIFKYYEELVSLYDEYLKTQNATDVINIFDEIHKNTNLTAIKKIDNAIWSLGAKPKIKQ